MSNNKQSSVEWFAEQLKEKMQMWNSTKNYQEFHIVLEAGEFAKLLEQAKAMHKEEIENAFVECWKANMPDGYECKLSANEYYNETYRGNEQ